MLADMTAMVNTVYLAGSRRQTSRHAWPVRGLLDYGNLGGETLGGTM